MKAIEIKDSLVELRKNISSIRADIGNYIQPKIGAILNEIPSPFGCTRWRADYNETKRVILDLYATGKIVFDLQNSLTTSEQASLDTSRDFLEPDMEPRIGSDGNYLDLWHDGQLDELVQKIKKHFEAAVV